MVRRGMDVEPHRDISFSCQHSEPGSREERKAGLLTLLRCIATGGRRTEGRGRTQELPAQTPQSERRPPRERTRERIGNGGVRFPKPQPTPFPVRAGERERGTQNNSVATKAKKTGTTDRHRRPVDRSKRVKKRTRRFLGENNANEEATTSVSHLLVLSSPLSPIDGHILPPPPPPPPILV